MKKFKKEIEIRRIGTKLEKDPLKDFINQEVSKDTLKKQED